MIQDELNTGLRWYDDLEKQGRYKEACAAVCDFRRLTPLNSILPFQFDTGEDLVGIVSWVVKCASNDIDTVDLTSEIASKLYSGSFEGRTHIFYNGSSIASLVLPCGYYYSVIETSAGFYYSEVFYCADITDTAFSQIDFPLFTAWRWYNNSEKQNRYKSYCKAVCDYYRVCGDDALLPFMFRKPQTSSIQIVTTAGGVNGVSLATASFVVSATTPDNLTVAQYWDGTELQSITKISGAWEIGGGSTWAAVIATINGIQSYYTWSIVGTTITITANTSLGAASSGNGLQAGYKNNSIVINSWVLRDVDGSCDHSLDTSPILFFNDGTYDYVFYLGGDISNLGCGKYESILTIDGISYYSELIEIINTIDTNTNVSYLLQENGSNLLQETEFGILLE